MHINKKHRVLDNKFNTVENLAKQIYSSNQRNIDFDIIDPSNPTKRVEKTIFEQIVQKVMPKKTVVWVNVYDIRHKDAILDFKRQARAARAVSPLEVDLRQRAISPQPRITLMGFSKDAFFDKRQGILKPCLKLKKSQHLHGPQQDWICKQPQNSSSDSHDRSNIKAQHVNTCEPELLAAAAALKSIQTQRSDRVEQAK